MNSYVILLLGNCLALSFTLPVTQTKSDDAEKGVNTDLSDIGNKLSYNRYMKEIVSVLESDPEFQRKLEKAKGNDIHGGKIDDELGFINHNVRTKLDEIRRREIAYLDSLASNNWEQMKNSQHLNYNNKGSFEVKDPKKLIMKTSHDLEEVDKKRKEDFKRYEMQLELENEEKKKLLIGEDRKKFEETEKAFQEKSKKHEKIHYPGHRAQLEEVWEKQYHLDKDDFDPRQFFNLYDFDNNGFWNEEEIEAFFINELDKAYSRNATEKVLRERAEEMARMRENVLREADTNADSLISKEEFIRLTNNPEYTRDEEWHTVNEQPQYTHEEYMEFVRKNKEYAAHANIPQAYYAHDPNVPYEIGQQHIPGDFQQQQMHYQQPQQQYMQQRQQYQQQQQQYEQHQRQQVHLKPNQIPVQTQQQLKTENNLPQQKVSRKNSDAHQQQGSNNTPSKYPTAETYNIPQQQ